MWSLPVTFGGGITITNRGEPGGPAGWNRPSASQVEYQRSSKCAGSKVFSSLVEDSFGRISTDSPVSASEAERPSKGFPCMAKGRKGPSPYQKRRGIAMRLRPRHRAAVGSEGPLLDAALEVT